MGVISMRKKILRTLLLALCVVVYSSSSYAENFQFVVYNPSDKSIFPVTSTVIVGKDSVALIDAQFQGDDAETIVDVIKDTGKKLEFVYISSKDPDFYFGLDEIKEAFPDVKILATQKTVDGIKTSMDDKLAYWGTLMKENAPHKLVLPQVVEENTMYLDGEAIEIMRSNLDSSYLWIPSEKTILGGTMLYDNVHAWTADMGILQARQEWLGVLDEMVSLAPENIIPGHFIGEYAPGTNSLFFTKKYIEDFNEAAEKSADSKELIASMIEAYPDLKGVEVLELSSKVVKGEMKWPVVPAFPGLGKVVEANFGDRVFHLKFLDESTMSFEGMSGVVKGISDTAIYSAIELRSGLYLVYWYEHNLKINVVHVEDYDRGLVYSSFVDLEGNFVRLSGTLKVLSDIEK